MTGQKQSERDIRIQKAEQYKVTVGPAYPAKAFRTHTIQEVLDNFDSLANTVVTITGRIRYWRDHGKLTFAQIEDYTGRIQVAFSSEELGTAPYDQLQLFDVGDIVQLTGKTFLTHKGEPSLLSEAITMLTKAIEPLPDKWHGLQDEEVRYRKRYLDMLMRPELREMFIRKSIFWQSIRNFLLAEGFVEVETPVLESTPGGADAEPFITHHDALDIDVYLRISMGELWQKRLMVGGFEKTFEIGRQFRNEGVSAEHLQDYTQMEFYWAYANYEDGMQLVERMYKHCIMQTFGTLRFTIGDFDIDLDTPWPTIDYCTVIRDQLGIDVLESSEAELHKSCSSLNLTITDGVGKGRLIDLLWKQCRKNISGPAFLVNHPVEVSPLAKRKVDDPRQVERFQIIIAGSELGNGYSELNDPIDQSKRFEEQSKLREAGDAEAQMHDKEFVQALEHGMPPTCGFGLSERVFSFLMDKPIRECVLFPLLKPKSQPDLQSDITRQEFDAGITREAAKQLLLAEVKDENLRRHMLATEALLRELAKHFKAPAVEAWGIAGLLHDIDWEKTEPKHHSLVGAEMLAKQGLHSEIVNAVREHNELHGIPARTLLSKNLQCLEQLTGLVIAATLVRPDKDIKNVKLSSLRKKFKDKAFAKGVNRGNIEKCVTVLGLSVDQAMELCLRAMQAAADEIGLTN